MSSLPSDGLATRGASGGPVDTVELTVPDLGPAADRAVVVSWAKGVGERVAVDEPICRLAVGELEFEVHSTAAGEVTRIIAAEGAGVLERSSLAEVAVTEQASPGRRDDGPAPQPKADPGPPRERIESIRAEPIDPEFAPVEDPPPEHPIEAIEVQPIDPRLSPADAPDQPEPAPGRRFAPDTPAAREREAATPDAAPPVAAQPTAGDESAAGPMPSGDVDWSRWVSPVVRALADEPGIDLDQVRGTGTGGRVRKRDVLEHVGLRPAGDA